MSRNEKTSKHVATIAADVMNIQAMGGDVVLFYSDTLDRPHLDFIPMKWQDIRTLAASCLTQAPDKPKRKGRSK